MATRYEFGLIDVINRYVVPLVLCWSVSLSAIPKLYVVQFALTAVLSVWAACQLFRNKKRSTHFLIAMAQQKPLLCDFALDGSLDSGGEGDTRMACQRVTYDNSKTDVIYQISPRSRHTQLCVFLLLEAWQARFIERPNERLAWSSKITKITSSKAHKIKRVTRSVILFRWQLSETHYRTLTSAIAQNAKSQLEN